MRFSVSLLLPAAALWLGPLTARSQPAQPVRLVSQSISNGLFGFGLSAPLGHTYELYGSANLSSWSLLANGTVGDNVSFVDGSTRSFSTRYYRAGLYWTMIVPNSYLLWFTTNGPDGRKIAYPFSNWRTTNGPDGRMITYPAGWTTNSGSDGRLIAYPAGWSTAKGPDGRLVAFPPTGCTLVTNADGRITFYPTSGQAGTNAYNSADWKIVTGGDGRQVAYPSSSFSTNQGPAGRLVAYVASGWTPVTGPDGRTLAYPAAEFTTNGSAAGRIIAFPISTWTTLQGPDGRTIAYPASDIPSVELDFEDQRLIALFGHLQSVLDGTDFYNYIIYTYFGTGEQRFVD